MAKPRTGENRKWAELRIRANLEAQERLKGYIKKLKVELKELRKRYEKESAYPKMVPESQRKVYLP